MITPAVAVARRTGHPGSSSREAAVLDYQKPKLDTEQQELVAAAAVEQLPPDSKQHLVIDVVQSLDTDQLKQIAVYSSSQSCGVFNNVPWTAWDIMGYVGRVHSPHNLKARELSWLRCHYFT
jgi:hypothetical protein